MCRRHWLSFAVTLGLMSLSIGIAQAADDLSKLIGALGNRDEKVRVTAIDTLGHMGPAAKGAVTELGAALADTSPAVRAHAARALGHIGSDASEATPALVKALSDADPHVRRAAIEALHNIRPNPETIVDALQKALEDPDPAVGVTALNCLTDLGEAAVPTLSKALENPKTRYWAALGVGELGADGKAAVPALIAALEDKDGQVQREVLLALGKMGEYAAPGVPQIIPLVGSADPAVRHAAAFALGRIGPPAAAAADALRKALQEGDTLQKTVDSWALARVEPKNAEARKQAIELLSAAVHDKNPRVQGAALRGLMDLEPRPATVVALVGSLLAKGEGPVLNDAFEAASALGPAATPALIEGLKRPETRGHAAMLLARIGEKASPAVPDLAAALADKDPDVRREILFALGAMGPDAASAIKPIVAQLADPELRVRAFAAFALGRIGPAAKSATVKLHEGLESTEPVVRVASAWALVHIDGKNDQVARETVPVLMQGLKNETVAVRRGSAEALGLLGKAALGAQQPLKAATHDSDESVRKAALLALERMGVVVDSPTKTPVKAEPRK